jgi:hypothetical protein
MYVGELVLGVETNPNFFENVLVRLDFSWIGSALIAGEAMSC